MQPFWAGRRSTLRFTVATDPLAFSHLSGWRVHVSWH
jgi:hypothetical protein